MTPDGISDDDWHRVHHAACDIVNASAAGDEVLCEHHHERLFEIIGELETVYGRLPSLLATRADFMDDDASAIPLLQEALVACEDPVSEQLTLDSLIGRMINQHFPDEIIQTHLTRLESIITSNGDDGDQAKLAELKKAFQRMS